jgi:tRNA 5-methylaminomethyl-2-thiouridine biosynthesis bifunctional protein
MYEALDWTDNDCPRSLRFNDVYRSRSGGLLQAQAVFLNGCHLPQQWEHRTQFTVLETGFGLGLNFLLTWSAWASDARRCETLHFVSIEAYPVAGEDIVRSLLGCDTAPHMDRARLLQQAQQLAAQWQHLKPGIQTLALAEGRVQLTLAIGEVLPMLAQLDCIADAVYLDGFNPRLNPQMWSQETVNAVRQRCQPGTVLATYSAAANVRAALKNAGFSVRRRPGLPPKWHRLEGRLDLPG